MSTSFEFEIDEYTVGMGWSTELTDFRWIFTESVGPAWSRIHGTLYFFPSGRGSLPLGSFRSPTRILVTLDLRDFDGVYAVLRSERPVFLRGRADENIIEYLELHTNSEPVGEVDTTPGGVIVVGTGELITEVEALASARE